MASKPSPMARAIAKYAHAGVLGLIDAGLQNGAPIVGFKVTPRIGEITEDEMEAMEAANADCEVAMAMLLEELIGWLADHPIMLYTLACFTMIAKGYEFEAIEQETSETDGGSDTPGEKPTSDGAGVRDNQADRAAAAVTRQAGPSKEHRGAHRGEARPRKNNKAT